jgi:chromosome segregation ATPase
MLSPALARFDWRADRLSTLPPHLKGLASPLPEPLDFALIKRLHEVLDQRPATETELRTLKEQAEAWERTVNGQLQASERRIRRLNSNPASSLAQIAGELRRVENLRPQLNEVRSLLSDLENRARELRTEWLLSQATSGKATSRRSSGRRS